MIPKKFRDAASSVLALRIPPPLAFPGPALDLAAGLSSLRGRVSTLSPVERLLVAMRHKEPDRVPCGTMLGGACRHLTGVSFDRFSTDEEAAMEAGMLALDVIDGDVQVLGLDLSVEASDFGQAVVYPPDSTARPDYGQPLLRDASDYERLKPIRLADAPRMQRVVRMSARAVAEHGTRAVFAPVVSSPLSVLSMMRGVENLFKDCILHPKKVRAALETVTGVLIEYIHALCDTGLLVISPDMLFAAQSGLGKDLWESMEGPWGREMARAIHDRGRLVAIHNCGDGPHFDSLIRFMEPEAISFARLPPDCRDLRDLKKRYGGQTALIGCVETALLIHGTPVQVMERCKQIMDDLAPGGGFVLSPGCEFPPDAPLINAAALVAAARLYS